MPRDVNSEHEDRIRLGHMLAAAEEAISFTRGRSRADLDVDRMLTRALVHCVQEIGEAAARVSDAGRDRAPNIRWAKMVGMRHILVHEYHNIDEDIVWRTVSNELPALSDELRRTLGAWPQSPDTGP